MRSRCLVRKHGWKGGRQPPHDYSCTTRCVMQYCSRLVEKEVYGIRPENSACRVPAFVRLDNAGEPKGIVAAGSLGVSRSRSVSVGRTSLGTES